MHRCTSSILHLVKYLAVTGLLTSSAFADVMPLVQRDEISGQNEYSVAFLAESYRRISDEDILILTCKPNGELLVSFHYGYQVSGVRLSPSTIITVKFDNQEPLDMTLRSFLGERIMNDVRRASTMLIRVPHRTATFRFNLNGSTRALEPFKQQCGV
jgi:hypothetical protein